MQPSHFTLLLLSQQESRHPTPKPECAKWRVRGKVVGVALGMRKNLTKLHAALSPLSYYIFSVYAYCYRFYYRFYLLFFLYPPHLYPCWILLLLHGVTNFPMGINKKRKKLLKRIFKNLAVTSENPTSDISNHKFQRPVVTTKCQPLRLRQYLWRCYYCCWDYCHTKMVCQFTDEKQQSQWHLTRFSVTLTIAV